MRAIDLDFGQTADAARASAGFSLVDQQYLQREEPGTSYSVPHGADEKGLTGTDR